MTSLGHALSEFVQNLVAFVLMIILAIVSFFFVVFVIDVGASWAGYGNNEYVVLSAALIVSAAILAGGISPLGYLSETTAVDERKAPAPADD